MKANNLPTDYLARLYDKDQNMLMLEWEKELLLEKDLQTRICRLL